MRSKRKALSGLDTEQGNGINTPTRYCIPAAIISQPRGKGKRYDTKRYDAIGQAVSHACGGRSGFGVRPTRDKACRAERTGGSRVSGHLHRLPREDPEAPVCGVYDKAERSRTMNTFFIFVGVTTISYQLIRLIVWLDTPRGRR